MSLAGRLTRLERRAGARAVVDDGPSAADLEDVKRTLAAVGWLDWCTIKNGWRPVVYQFESVSLPDTWS